MEIRRTKIVDAVKMTTYDVTVNVKGWVRTKRGNKNVSFIALNDGSTINNIQIVADASKFSEELMKNKEFASMTDDLMYALFDKSDSY